MTSNPWHGESRSIYYILLVGRVQYTDGRYYRRVSTLPIACRPSTSMHTIHYNVNTTGAIKQCIILSMLCMHMDQTAAGSVYRWRKLNGFVILQESKFQRPRISICVSGGLKTATSIQICVGCFGNSLRPLQVQPVSKACFQAQGGCMVTTHVT